jgi:hypothetical protein
MKHLVRFVSVLIVITIILTTPLAVFAQDGNPLCSGLSAEDCDTLLAALDTLNTVQSFTIPAWEVSFDMDDGSQTVSLSASGQAGYAAGEMVTDTVLHVVIDEISMTPAEGEIPEYVEVILADGFGYINYDGQWYGEELSESDLADFEDMFGMAGGESMGLGLESLGIDLTGVVTTTRGADEDMMGMSLAPYTMEVDIAGLVMAALASPMVGEAMGMAGEEAMSPEELQMMGAIFAPILGDTSISAGVWVGNDDGFIHRVELNLALDVDMTMFDPEAGAITGGLNFSADVSNIDEGYSVEAPTDYGTMEEFNEAIGDLDLGSLGDLTGGLF